MLLDGKQCVCAGLVSTRGPWNHSVYAYTQLHCFYPGLINLEQQSSLAHKHKSQLELFSAFKDALEERRKISLSYRPKCEYDTKVEV